MMLQGYLNYAGDGLGISTRAMTTQMSILNVHTDNIAHFGIPGYQKKESVVTSFVEVLGANAVDKVTNTEIGRLRKSGSPMDFALNCQGYFQKLNALGGIELTRDGRFQIDKDGSMRALDGKRILSAAGIPIQLPIVPQDPDRQVKVSPMGDITVYDPASGEALPAGRIGVATESGSLVGDVDIKQGYVEDSNVMLQEEYVAIMPLRRQFEANRQMFILQSDSLSRMIQELGRGQ